MKNTALRPGYAVQVLPTKYAGPNKATIPESMPRSPIITPKNS